VHRQPEGPIAIRALAPILEGCLRTHLHPRAKIARLERSPSPYSSSYAIEDLDVHLADGTYLQLVFKNLGPDGLLTEARRAKPAFLSDPEREIAMYRDLLDPLGIQAPRFYGALIDQEAGRYWLFVERVPGTPLSQVGSWEVWLAVARWLAQAHARLSSDASRWPRRAIRYDARFYRLWLERALRACEPEQVHHLVRLAPAHERAAQALTSMDSSLIHGELYASNVLVANTAHGPRVCPIDWEMAAIAPPLMDLAALTAGRWDENERTALALAYRDVARDELGLSASEAEFLRDLACCRLHIAVQWLGWSTSWAPPRDQAHDWLGEARSAAGVLGFRLDERAA
jgi:aminoglycoside phosphotransferase (APT) family kinase protein